MGRGTTAFPAAQAERAGRAALGQIGRRLAETLAAERERWILWLPVALGTGVGIYFALPLEPPLAAGPVVFIGLLAVGFLRRPRGGNLVFLIALAAVTAGFAVAQLRTHWVAAPIVDGRLGPTQVIGRVVAVEPQGAARRVTVEDLEISRLASHETPRRARIRVTAAAPGLQPGDRIAVRAVLTPPPPPVAPGAFDFQRQSYFRGLGAVGFAMGAPVLLAAAEDGQSGLADRLAALRQRLGERIMAALPHPEGTVARALMVGERGAIPDRVIEAMRDSGLAHLLAISGLHLGLVAGLLYVGVRALLALIAPVALRWPIKKIAAVLGIAGAAAYAIIAGVPIPTQRAFLMVGLILLAVLLDRRGLGIRTVALAATVVLLIQPESLLGASFQLSFAAVTALVAIYEEISEARVRGGSRRPSLALRPFVYLGGVALSTLIAGTVTAPFAIFHFNRLAVFGLAANLGAVPITALWIMPWAIGAFLLMPFGLAGLALAPMGWGIAAVIEIAEAVAAWPGAVTLLPAMPTWGMAVVVLGGLWLFLWRRRWRFLGVIPIAAGLATAATAEPPDVLVDDRGELLAVRMADDSLAVSSLRVGRFDREAWLRRDGQEEAPRRWPGEGPSADGRIACDRLGCIYKAKGYTVALVHSEGALDEDCRLADVVVAAVPVRRTCPSAATVIDRFDLWRNGAHAVWLGGDGVQTRSVNGLRGDRPWVPKPRRTTRREAD